MCRHPCFRSSAIERAGSCRPPGHLRQAPEWRLEFVRGLRWRDGGTWEESMAARASARADDRINRRHRPLAQDRPGHIGHHLHRSSSGTRCSCGDNFQEACHVTPGEDGGWWTSQRCTVCGRTGALLASGNAKILVSGQLSPGSRTPEFLVRGQVTSVATL
jgi:hypothetical protein